MSHKRMSERLMFIPRHCSEVAVINAGEGFSPEKTIEELLGKCVYYLTKYVILREREGQLKNGERVSVIKVRAEGKKFLKTIVDGEVLAPPEKCMTLTDSTLDEFTLNQVALSAASAREINGMETIVLSGRNGNITFVRMSKQDLILPLKILLVDVTPPTPSRLETLTRAGRRSGQISEHINIECLNVDTSKMVKEALKEGRQVLIPCQTNESNPHIISFKEIAKITERNEPLSVDLLGCSLSGVVLDELSKITGLSLETSLRDMCPLHAARNFGLKTDVQAFIVRCCKLIGESKVIHIKGKPLITLPWTPTLGEFVKAIDDVVRLVTGMEIK